MINKDKNDKPKKENNAKEKNKQKSLQDKHEELRRWFDAMSDCV
jgi:hypothetical protein